MRFTASCTTRLLLLLSFGCASFQPVGSWRANAVPSTAGKDEIVAIVNRNVAGGGDRPALNSWRCTQAKFQIAPMPMSADGTIIVEAPRSFRMRVSHPIGGGDELDVGSNTEEFWIWQKDMQPPRVLTARHEDMDLALQHFRIPFQPDWIMEVMGVVPIDPSQYELRIPPNGKTAELTARVRSPRGEAARKVIRVDLRRGWVVSHELWEDSGKLIASAELSDHEADSESGLVIPRKFRIRWPEAELDLRITLRHVEVNPPRLPAMVWQLPEKPGFSRLDMGAYARLQMGQTDIQRVGDGASLDSRRQDAPLRAAAVSERMAEPAPSVGGPRPFPGTPFGQPSSSPPTESLPPRDQSAPLEKPGRVRLDGTLQ